MIFLHFFLVCVRIPPYLPSSLLYIYIYVYIFSVYTYILIQYRIRTYVCMYDFLTLMNNIIGNGPLVFKGK